MKIKSTLVSVIIPAYNAAGHLAITLPALRKTEYENYEIIVVDSSPGSSTAELAEKNGAFVLKLGRKSGPGEARNLGVEKSRGSILFFMDADVLVYADTVSRIVREMDMYPDTGSIFGSYDEEPSHKNFFSQYKNLFHHYIHQNANIEGCTFWAGCGAVRRKVFLETGGFPEKYSSPSIEDVEFGYKMTERGVGIRLVKDLQVKHLKRWSFSSLIKSDILNRAIPWTKLAVEKGLPVDLNFRLSDRVSGIVACILFLSLLLAIPFHAIAILCPFLMLLLVLLNIRLYRFFLRKRGAAFTLKSVLSHWFYLLYSTAVFVLFYIIFTVRAFFGETMD